jgi:hypothetical protein
VFEWPKAHVAIQYTGPGEITPNDWRRGLHRLVSAVERQTI